MRRLFLVATGSVVSVALVMACVGDDPENAPGGIDGGGTEGSVQNEGGSPNGGADSGGPNEAGAGCGYPGEDCCQTGTACRVGTACSSGKCLVNDLWVVGYRFESGLNQVGASIHYDGATWTKGPVALTTNDFNPPIAAWGLAPGSYRAVNTAGDALILDTDFWEICDNSLCGDPNTTNQLSAIFGFGTNDYWIAGTNIMHHCIGPTCAARATGLPGTFGASSSLTGTSSNDMWYPSGGALYHYDGGTWGPSDGATQVTAAFARTPTDVWIGTNTFQHFDGTSWSAPMMIGGGPAPGTIYSIHGSAADDVWAVGFNNSGVPFSAHWDGAAWSDVPFPAAAGQLSNVWVASKSEVFVAAAFEHGVYKREGADWTKMTMPTLDGGAGSPPVLQAYTWITGSSRPRP